MRLRVNDAGAAYPLVVDPFVQQAKLTASGGVSGDNFGFSVAISCDTVVVGSPSDDIGVNTDQGWAYVFVRPGGGWTGMTEITAKLTASDGTAYAYFGSSVAIDGNTVVVGAPGHDTGINFTPGSAYVFTDIQPDTCRHGPVTIGSATYSGTQRHWSETRFITSGSVTIASCANINLRAGSSIALNPGFQARAGSRFAGRIAPVSCPDRAIQTARSVHPTGRLETVRVIESGQPAVLASQRLSQSELPEALQSRLHAAGAKAHELHSDAEGQYIAFSTDITLDTRDDNDHEDVYLYEVYPDRLQLGSVNPEGEVGNGASTHPRIDGAGLHIAFQTDANNLTETDHNSVSDIYLYSIGTRWMDRLSWPIAASDREAAATHPAIGGEGPLVLYQREDALGYSQI